MIPGKATPQGTAAYAKTHAAHPGHWRPALGLTLSSLGLGTYLGNLDGATDAKYTATAVRALELGINVIDSAINYRCQRSERSIGAGLQEAIEKGLVAREEVLLCTKGGFISGDGGPPSARWFQDTYLRPGLATPDDIVADCHCMAPGYLKHEVEQSRRNLGVETIDVYYVHNPETQMPEVGEGIFYERLTQAFRALEECASEGKIQWYGTATWDAYRSPGEDPSHVDLARVLACAEAAGGKSHRFRVIQLPFNLGMAEAFGEPTQAGKPALAAAAEAGLAVFTSVPLLQTRLLGRIPKKLQDRFAGLTTDAQRCLQFARSTPGITAPLAGMKDVRHVEENAKVASVAPLAKDEFERLFSP